MASLSTPLHRFLPRQGLRLMTMCSHIPGNGDIYDDVHTSLNLISNQFPARSLGSRLAVIGHDWVPYSWSNSKLIFLILNNEKPWAPWRRKTEKLIDQLSLSFFKAAPNVQTRQNKRALWPQCGDIWYPDIIHITWGLHKPVQIRLRYEGYGAAVRVTSQQAASCHLITKFSPAVLSEAGEHLPFLLWFRNDKLKSSGRHCQMVLWVADIIRDRLLSPDGAKWDRDELKMTLGE